MFNFNVIMWIISLIGLIGGMLLKLWPSTILSVIGLICFTILIIKEED